MITVYKLLRLRKNEKKMAMLNIGKIIKWRIIYPILLFATAAHPDPAQAQQTTKADAFSSAGGRMASVNFETALIAGQSSPPDRSESGSIGNMGGFFAQLWSLTGVNNVTQNISLPSGWSMISSYIRPPDPSLTTVLVDITSQLIIIKNGEGRFYWPGWGINTIGSWNHHHGYKICMQSPLTLVINGIQLQPETEDISLAQGWNLAAYLRDSPISIVTALSGIVSNLTIAKNGAGQVYWPAYSINTIGSMQPGEGYQMYLTQATTLTYPANTLPKETLPAVTSIPSCMHFTGSKQMTGSNAVFLWLDLPFTDGDEIAVYDDLDQLVGSSAVRDGQTLLVVWGDDSITEIKDGASEDEVLALRRWSCKKDAEFPLMPYKITNALTGQPVDNEIRYEHNAVLILEAVTEEAIHLPLEYRLMQNYPNPFNPNTTIEYQVPKAIIVELVVYNLSGVKVRTLVNGFKPAGDHEVIWDGRDDDNRLVSSGIYWIKMKAGDFRKMIKMSLVK